MKNIPKKPTIDLYQLDAYQLEKAFKHCLKINAQKITNNMKTKRTKNHRSGVASLNHISELPPCFDWKKIPNTDDYENQYGHIVEIKKKK